MPSTTTLVVLIGVALAIFGLRRLSRVAERELEAERLTAINWSSFQDYGALTEAADGAHALAPDEFLNGPFKRFLEICTDAREHPRVRARTLEFGRGVLWRYCQAKGAEGADASLLEARGRAMAVEWFTSPGAPDGEYMLEVLDGVSNHNSRGTRSDAEAGEQT